MLAALVLFFLLGAAGASREVQPDGVLSDYKAFSLYESFTFRHPYHPGHDINARIKILFPADRTSTSLRPDPARKPFPVVVFLAGAYIESNRYQWLGEKLAGDCGLAWVVVDMLVPLGPTQTLVSMPGAAYDPQKQNPGLLALFQKLRHINKHHQLLNGYLDVDRVILGGHSWGGRVVLVDGANKGFFPNVVGAFVYAAHAERIPGPGYIPKTMLPLEGSTPLLLMAGNRDVTMGMGIASSFKSGNDAMTYMFEEAIDPKRECYYVLLDGYDHSSIVYPKDETLQGRKGEEDMENERAMMEEFYRLVSLFAKKYAFEGDHGKDALDDHLFEEKSRFIKDVRVKG